MISDALWKELEALSEIEVRQRLGAGRYAYEKKDSVLQWLAFRESSESSDQRRKTLEVANEANDLARSANAAASEANVIARRAADSARETAEAARSNNVIATAALIAAAIAIALSIIGMFLRK